MHHELHMLISEQDLETILTTALYTVGLHGLWYCLEVETLCGWLMKAWSKQKNKSCILYYCLAQLLVIVQAKSGATPDKLQQKWF